MTIPMPDRISRLPFDQTWNLPVPWFVAKVDDKFDFRVADGDKWYQAVTQDLCWVCGEPMGSFRAFVIGPMCSVNRVSSDPPMHRYCAEYACQVCPFLVHPQMVRRQKDRLPETEQREMPGIYIDRNPGVALLWVCRPRPEGYKIVDGHPGYLFRLIGKPTHLHWYAHGRDATRAEVIASIESGAPLLEQHIESQVERRAFEKAREEAMKLVPA